VAWTNVRDVSVESRLNRVYPMMEALGQVPFIWQVATEGNWFVASANGVQIRSSITEPLY
jgi:hypothetical protein